MTSAGGSENTRVGGVIVGQNVDWAKVERAKQFRHEMTPAERILWRHLRTDRLGGLHCRRQQVIDGFIVDFYCHEAGLVVEVDGASHQLRPEYDAARDQVLAERGLRVLRFRNEEVGRTIQSVLQRIVSELDTPPIPPTAGTLTQQ